MSSRWHEKWPGRPAPSTVPSGLTRARGQQSPTEHVHLYEVEHVQAQLTIVPLDDDDAPEMLELAQRTKPGPFAARTHRLGSFFGLRDNGALIAMAGERLRPPGWTEISAVCTDEAYRGRGLGRALMEHVIDGIRARGEQPFLHVAATNAGAIRLYERMGFEARRASQVAVFGLRV